MAKSTKHTKTSKICRTALGSSATPSPFRQANLADVEPDFELSAGLDAEYTNCVVTKSVPSSVEMPSESSEVPPTKGKSESFAT
jgi:hypothetical protein